jgi:hypothetical protein
LVANTIGPILISATFNHGNVVDFRGLWLVPLISAIGAAVALALLFHPPDKTQSRVGVPVTSH